MTTVLQQPRIFKDAHRKEVQRLDTDLFMGSEDSRTQKAAQYWVSIVEKVQAKKANVIKDVRTLEQLAQIINQADFDDFQNRAALYAVINEVVALENESSDYLMTFIKIALQKVFDPTAPELTFAERNAEPDLEKNTRKTVFDIKKKLTVLFSDERAVKELLVNCPGIANKLPSTTLQGIAKKSSLVARHIFSTPTLMRNMETHQYVRYQVYEAHVDNLWLADQVLTPSQVIQRAIHRGRVPANDGSVRERPANWQRIDDMYRELEELSKQKTIFEERLGHLLSLNEQLKNKTIIELKVKQTNSTQALDLEALNQRQKDLSGNNLNVNFTDAEKAEYESNGELISTLEFIEILRAKVGVDQLTAQAIQQKRQQIESELNLVKIQYDAHLKTLNDLVDNKFTEAATQRSLDHFLCRQVNDEEKKQSWQNVEDLMSLQGKYATLLDKIHIEAMFALANTQEKFNQVLQYLMTHVLQALIASNVLEQAATPNPAQPLQGVVQVAADNINKFAYQGSITQLIMAVPEICRQLYSPKNGKLEGFCASISETPLLKPLLDQQRHWLDGGHLLRVFAVDGFATPEKELSKYLRGKRDNNKLRPIDKLRTAVDTQITSSANDELLLNTLQNNFIRGTVNLTDTQVDTWLTKSNYKDEICQLIALDDNLIDKSDRNTHQDKNGYLNAAYEVRAAMKSSKRWFTNDAIDDFLKMFVARLQAPGYQANTNDQNICWYIANKPRFFERLQKLYVRKPAFIRYFGPSDDDISADKQKLAAISVHFQNKLDLAVVVAPAPVQPVVQVQQPVRIDYSAYSIQALVAAMVNTPDLKPTLVAALIGKITTPAKAFELTSVQGEGFEAVVKDLFKENSVFADYLLGHKFGKDADKCLPYLEASLLAKQNLSLEQTLNLLSINKNIKSDLQTKLKDNILALVPKEDNQFILDLLSNPSCTIEIIRANAPFFQGFVSLEKWNALFAQTSAQDIRVQQNMLTLYIALNAIQGVSIKKASNDNVRNDLLSSIGSFSQDSLKNVKDNSSRPPVSKKVVVEEDNSQTIARGNVEKLLDTNQLLTPELIVALLTMSDKAILAKLENKLSEDNNLLLDVLVLLAQEFNPKPLLNKIAKPLATYLKAVAVVEQSENTKLDERLSNTKVLLMLLQIAPTKGAESSPYKEIYEPFCNVCAAYSDMPVAIVKEHLAVLTAASKDGTLLERNSSIFVKAFSGNIAKFVAALSNEELLTFVTGNKALLEAAIKDSACVAKLLSADNFNVAAFSAVAKGLYRALIPVEVLPSSEVPVQQVEQHKEDKKAPGKLKVGSSLDEMVAARADSQADIKGSQAVSKKQEAIKPDLEESLDAKALINLLSFKDNDVQALVFSSAKLANKLLLADKFSVEEIKKYKKEIAAYLSNSQNRQAVEALPMSVVARLLVVSDKDIDQKLLSIATVALAILEDVEQKDNLHKYKGNWSELLKSNKEFRSKLKRGHLQVLLNLQAPEVLDNLDKIYADNPTVVTDFYATHKTKGDFEKYWMLYRPVFDEQVRKGVFVQEEFKVLLLANSPALQAWLAGLYSMHENGKVIVEFLFTTAGAEERRKNSKLYLPLLQEKYLDLNLDGLLGELQTLDRKTIASHADLFMYVVTKYIQTLDVKLLIKLFNEEGKTSESVQKKLAELFEQNPELAFAFIASLSKDDAKKVLKENPSLVKGLIIEANLADLTTDVVDKLISSEESSLIRSVFASARIAAKRSPIVLSSAAQVEPILELLVESAVDVRYLLSSQIDYSSVMTEWLSNFDNRKEALVALFKRTDLVAHLFQGLESGELKNFALIDGEHQATVTDNLFKFSSTPGFKKLLGNKDGTGEIFKVNQHFLIKVLQNDILRFERFVKGKDDSARQVEVVALYRDGNSLVRKQLHQANKDNFTVSALTDEQLKELVKTSNCLADLFLNADLVFVQRLLQVFNKPQDYQSVGIFGFSVNPSFVVALWNNETTRGTLGYGSEQVYLLLYKWANNSVQAKAVVDLLAQNPQAKEFFVEAIKNFAESAQRMKDTKVKEFVAFLAQRFDIKLVNTRDNAVVANALQQQAAKSNTQPQEEKRSLFAKLFSKDKANTSTDSTNKIKDALSNTIVGKITEAQKLESENKKAEAFASYEAILSDPNAQSVPKNKSLTEGGRLALLCKLIQLSDSNNAGFGGYLTSLSTVYRQVADDVSVELAEQSVKLIANHLLNDESQVISPNMKKALALTCLTADPAVTQKLPLETVLNIAKFAGFAGTVDEIKNTLLQLGLIQQQPSVADTYSSPVGASAALTQVVNGAPPAPPPPPKSSPAATTKGDIPPPPPPPPPGKVSTVQAPTPFK